MKSLQARLVSCVLVVVGLGGCGAEQCPATLPSSPMLLMS
jgi:hypothetical protein